MEVVNLTTSTNTDFIKEVERESGQKVSLCYQCGKCTAGCPFAFAFDYPPHQIMRLLQNGQKDTILKSHTIWLCAGCETCTTRCPCEIDLARVMDVLHRIALRENYVSEKNIKLFHEIFLDSIKQNGRVFEAGLAVKYNVKSGKLFNNANLAPAMISKGKLRFKPNKIKEVGSVSKLFERSKEKF
jgi:heterodisulfide reductase subunit C